MFYFRVGALELRVGALELRVGALELRVIVYQYLAVLGDQIKV